MPFLFWHLAAHRGLIDAVGGAEWFSCHNGTELCSKAWFDKYEKLSSTKTFQKAVAIVVDDIKKTRDGLCENCPTDTPGHPPQYCLTYNYLCHKCDEELYLEDMNNRLMWQ